MSSDGMGECRASIVVSGGSGAREGCPKLEGQGGQLLPRIPNEITLDLRGAGTHGKRPQSEVQGGQLLPGIPNEITLEQICTKLAWRAFYSLSSVSPAWRRAIQSHRVYDARVRSHSADTLVVHNHYRDESDTFQVVALYSSRDKCCFELPAIPGVERGIPWACECISLDGKIYVLGGAKEYDLEEEHRWQTRSMVSRVYDDDEDEEKEVYKEVYVLDLAGQRRWQQCESMQEGRYRFACGVMNGKIYVFGGAGSSGPVRGSEVYDPEVKAWSPIKPMPSLRCWGHRVTTLGEEFCVYGGGFYDAETAKKAEKNPYSNHEWLGYDFIEEALNLEVYHPMKDEWRVVDPFLENGQCTRTIFEARGELHVMIPEGICVYASEKNGRKVLHKNSFAAIGPTESTTVFPCATAVVNDVLFAGVGWHPNEDRRQGGMCLLEGRGFGSNDKEISWQILSNCSCDFEDIMQIMQL